MWLNVGLLALVVAVVSAEDFYDRLGVSRQATNREIRRAFKKVALEKHPDKNQDDPQAHEKFLKINRAYEVLKDEDLRKKYDTHGEEGLNEDSPTGRGYQNWNFYKEDFGIYDDDEEVITLSKADFEQSVENTDDIWFINFYSPQCHHCHDLAPTWREVARELEGVIRIGAVNCGDDWAICRQQRISSYPSLLIYPQREKYMGMKTTAALVKHALRQVQASVVELWSGNWRAMVEQDEQRRARPWLISVCGDGGDCLERLTLTKLAAMLDDLVNVGELFCSNNEKICDKIGVEYGTYFFDAGQVEKGKGMEIQSLDAKEVALSVLGQLPEVRVLDKDTFKKAQSDTQRGEGTTWLIHFVEGEVTELELRKLPAMLPEFNVGRVDCSQMRSECDALHIRSFPVFMVLKKGGGHEIHHGRSTAPDIAAFTRLSSEARVQVLGPADFPDRVVNTGEPWFVDFFAPWCPPCMRLLPEFRKASKLMSGVQFGTVDCTVHQRLCGQYNVNSYPTTIFYNQSTPHHFQGHHSVHDLVEFIQDTLSPPVIQLDLASFEKLVDNKNMNDIWLIDYFAPWCGPCRQLSPEWRKLAKMVKDIDTIHVAMVDCTVQKSLCQNQNVRNYPSVRLYPTGRTDSRRFFSYNGWFRDAQSIRAWAFEYLPSKVVDLDWQSFQDALSSSEPWVVDFFAPWCGHCQVFAPELEKVAQALEGVVNVGKVDCDNHGRLCQQAGIGGYPTLRFYKGVSHAGGKQGTYGEDIDSQDADYITRYLRQKAGGKQKKIKDEL